MNFQESYELFQEIFAGKISEKNLEKILRDLSEKGESFEEIAGAAKAMKESAIPVETSEESFDVCGTGGSGNAKTFNLSTTVSIVLASLGIKIAKHGNRAASSKSGSADVLEELGISLADTPEQMSEKISSQNIAFLFAQKLHPAMKFVMPVRKKIGTRTIFNLLGPLTNPANPVAQIVGVSDKKFLEPIARALQLMGKKSAIVVCGSDGLDEVTLTGKTFFAKFCNNNEIETGEICPEQFGMIPVHHEKISGGGAKQNAKIITEIFSGKISGPKKDIVLLNCAVALEIFGKSGSIEEGIAMANEAIISGKALAKLEQMQN